MKEIFEFRPMVQEEMPFEGIACLELRQPFCSAECSHLCNFDKGYYEEQFCEIILNLDQRLRRKCFLKHFLSGALADLLFVERNHLCNFERGHQREYSCEVIRNLDQWFRRRYHLKKKFTDRRTTHRQKLITIAHLSRT